jgi:hypothetical protein
VVAVHAVETAHHFWARLFGRLLRGLALSHGCPLSPSLPCPPTNLAKKKVTASAEQRT